VRFRSQDSRRQLYTLDLAIRSICDEIDDKLVFIGFSVMTVQIPGSIMSQTMVKSQKPGCDDSWGGVIQSVP
jgi:hypothetical protein